MKYLFDVALLPSEKLKEHDCRIVVDLLRASTQITTFFDAGGEVLLPVPEAEDPTLLRQNLGEDWKLMGERGGLRLPGFDFGNSPLELTLKGAPKNAIITTSNGTGALMAAARGCAEVRVGCARNAEAVVWDALCSGTRIGIIASGCNGGYSMEDTVCAGMLVEKMLALAPSNGGTEMELTDGAIAAMALWHHFGPDITSVCMESEHGRILQGLGFTDDIVFCGVIDATAAVPRVSYFNGIMAIVGR
ncbi:MAG: 2-phosphosulfolactate phosphatase [Synergistaceae bacterium]|nr:2-phosphosulfolactate phosphatase [Synergistaceae bacterium]